MFISNIYTYLDIYIEEPHIVTIIHTPLAVSPIHIHCAVVELYGSVVVSFQKGCTRGRVRGVVSEGDRVCERGCEDE